MQQQSTQLSAEQKEAQFRDGWKQLVLMCARAQKRKEQNIQEVYISNASVTAQLGALGCALLPRRAPGMFSRWLGISLRTEYCMM